MIVYIVEQEWRPDFWIPRPPAPGRFRQDFYTRRSNAERRIHREKAKDRKAGAPEGVYRIAEYVRREP